MGTIETAYLESAWISRQIKLSFTPVYLSFKLELDNNNETEFTIQARLLDTDRRPIGPLIGTLDEKAIPAKPSREAFKSAQFAWRVLYEPSTSFKVQFHIRYHDKKPKEPAEFPN